MCHLFRIEESRQHHVHDMDTLNENSPAPVESPTPEPPAAAAPPPAAHLVAHGTKRDPEIELGRQLEESAAEIRQREMRIVELERDNQELRKISAPPAPKRRAGFSPLPIFTYPGED